MLKARYFYTKPKIALKTKINSTSPRRENKIINKLAQMTQAEKNHAIIHENVLYGKERRTF